VELKTRALGKVLQTPIAGSALYWSKYRQYLAYQQSISPVIQGLSKIEFLFSEIRDTPGLLKTESTGRASAIKN
jgi:hypothetical protein